MACRWAEADWTLVVDEERLVSGISRPGVVAPERVLVREEEDLLGSKPSSRNALLRERPALAGSPGTRVRGASA
jgi:hypothetical protein